MPSIPLIEIHMAAAHFPIGLLCSSVFLDTVGLVAHRPKLRETAWHMHLLGILAAAVTVTLGLVGNPFRGAIGDTAVRVMRHEWFGITTLVIFGALALWRARQRNTFRGLSLVLYSAATVAGCVVVGVTGYLGAQLAR